MKQLLILFVLTLVVNTLSAQQKKYVFGNPKEEDIVQQDTTQVKEEIVNPALYKYYKARQAAFFVGASGILVAGAGLLVTGNDDPKIGGYLLMGAGAMEFISWIMFWGADTRLKEAALTITPTGAVMKF